MTYGTGVLFRLAVFLAPATPEKINAPTPASASNLATRTYLH